MLVATSELETQLSGCLRFMRNREHSSLLWPCTAVAIIVASSLVWPGFHHCCRLAVCCVLTAPPCDVYFFPLAQGPFYCGVGTNSVFGRPLAEAHMEACLEAGLTISGINAEVGQQYLKNRLTNSHREGSLWGVTGSFPAGSICRSVLGMSGL
jgi:hypothetical protein